MTRDSDPADQDNTLAGAVDGANQLSQFVYAAIRVEAVKPPCSARVDGTSRTHCRSDVQLHNPQSFPIVHPFEPYWTQVLACSLKGLKHLPLHRSWEPLGLASTHHKLVTKLPNALDSDLTARPDQHGPRIASGYPR